MTLSQHLDPTLFFIVHPCYSWHSFTLKLLLITNTTMDAYKINYWVKVHENTIIIDLFFYKEIIIIVLGTLECFWLEIHFQSVSLHYEACSKFIKGQNTLTTNDTIKMFSVCYTLGGYNINTPHVRHLTSDTIKHILGLFYSLLLNYCSWDPGVLLAGNSLSIYQPSLWS